MLSPDYRPAGVRPARFYLISEPEGMTAKEHAAVIRDSLARDRDVQFIHANKQHREKAADFTWDELINDDSARELLMETIRIEAAGGSDVAISVAFKRFVARAIDRAAEAAENIDSQGQHFTYLPKGAAMNWGLIEYEAEKLVPRRQKVADIGCCLIVLATVFWAVPWVSSLIIESGALK